MLVLRMKSFFPCFFWDDDDNAWDDNDNNAWDDNAWDDNDDDTRRDTGMMLVEIWSMVILVA